MVRIVTDTASDITKGQAAAMGVDLAPLDVSFEGLEYAPLQDESFSEFYTLLQQCDKLPKTSQPPPESYLAIFEDAEQNDEEVVVICLSAGLSGTYQSACIARELSGYDKVYILNSKTAAIGQRLLVDMACEMRSKGSTAQEIFNAVSDASERVVLYASLDTLRYLRKGGRIPRSAELVGSMLNIKPIITLNSEGVVEMAGKARGHAGCITGLVKMIDGNPEIDNSVPVYFGYTQDSLPCKKFEHIAIPRYGLHNHVRYQVGATVGTHVGPGAVAVVYLLKK